MKGCTQNLKRYLWLWQFLFLWDSSFSEMNVYYSFNYDNNDEKEAKVGSYKKKFT